MTTSSKLLSDLRHFVLEYHHAIFGGNWNTNKGKAEGGRMCPPPPQAYMVPRDPSLNRVNGKPSDILYTGYLNKDISFGDIVYFEPKHIQHKKLINGVTDQFKISLIDEDGNEISINFKISVLLHIV